MSSRPKLTSTLSRGINKFTSKFRPGSPSSVRWYTNRLGHKMLDNRVPQKTIDKLNEIRRELDNILHQKTLFEYQVQEITKLKIQFEFYERINPNKDSTGVFNIKKKKIMKELSNIDWETIIYFYKKNINNSEYKTIIRLIYEFAQLLQTGDVITLNSVDEYENDLSQELVNVSREILYCHIQNIEQKRGRGKIKKPKKPKKPKKHTLVKKKKRKKKSTIKI